MPRAGMPRSPSEQGGKRAAPSASARKAASAKGLTGLKGRAYVGAAINRAKEEKHEAKAAGAKKGMGKPPASPKPRARKPKPVSPEDEELKRLRARQRELSAAKANRARDARQDKLAQTPEDKIHKMQTRRNRLNDEKRAIHEAIRQMNAHTRRGSADEIQGRVREKGKLNDRLTAIDAELTRIDKKLAEISHARAARGSSPEVNAAALRAAAEERAHTRGRR